ncbi:MAG: hypothetical protein ABL995_12140 [Bryobacteraceae bacterium]
MIVFPQISTGASALYPLLRVCHARTVANGLIGGASVVAVDLGSEVDAWELHAVGLTTAERDAIEDLFALSRGSLGTFTFLDPVGNLLRHSEEFEGLAWSRGAPLQVTTGAADPFGGSRAVSVVNTGAASEEVGQTLPAPGNFMYCFSLWARSESSSMVELEFGGIAKPFALTPHWRRMWIAGNPQTSAENITFDIRFSAGAAAELYGAQVEPQLAPSDYKKTGNRGGVFSKARFADDRLTVIARGADEYDAVIRIVNSGS